uniref:glucose-1-phosphate adenylyltransferase n=1 Tax=Tetraselmis sp. GSL018 TaxID=582737 RepID=A0A061RS02_9CHLO|mmetsp:Transcript_37002/g.87928  ORF Transcript_37002/g.87928 Transcript_37002/m.87928 type:complete len:557 (-) Transcript_37002:208-1878(-)|eukprot:CAMPEP_0177622860 /NCGR_PEP_ID=MMETSP0419_2-20121207/28575_1 /TAXON_ID=582737 /ORGANISM="Tetraselmis sp., Strain GSL018" /LENGTH=556 /DNA_ID=CAMNT_0019123335 /DNA_START=285 /DNA_END=1955 /DNA_ORIENTATION=-
MRSAATNFFNPLPPWHGGFRNSSRTNRKLRTICLENSWFCTCPGSSARCGSRNLQHSTSRSSTPPLGASSTTSWNRAQLEEDEQDEPSFLQGKPLEPSLSSTSLAEEDTLPSLEEMSSTVHSLILAGGASNNPLALFRAVAAIPLGCTYRMVDVPISNCMTSGISKMYVLTQYMNASLNNHIATAYRPATFGGQARRGWVEVLAATQTPQCSTWSAGSADAVRWHLRTVFDPVSGAPPPQDLLVLSGQALYKMDFRELVALHRKSGSDVTIATISVSRERAGRLGIVRVSSVTGRVTAFVEKPGEEALEQMAHASSYSTAEEPFEASMGVYVFRREVLENLLLDRDSFTGRTQDIHFGRDVIPHALRAGYRVFAHHFSGYWRDVTKLRDYYTANLKFTSTDSPFSPASLESFMHAEPRMLPPSVVADSEIIGSLLGGGSWVIGSRVSHSVIGQCASVASGCVIEDSLVLGSDFKQQDPRRRPPDMEEQAVLSHLGIREGCVIRNAIIDKNACIGAGSRIVNAHGVTEADRKDLGYVIQDGIVTVLKNAVIPPGTVI